MNLRAELDKLDVHTDSRISVQTNYNFERFPMSLSGMVWFGTDNENNSGAEISFQLNWGNTPKL